MRIFLFGGAMEIIAEVLEEVIAVLGEIRDELHLIRKTLERKK